VGHLLGDRDHVQLRKLERRTPDPLRPGKSSGAFNVMMLSSDGVVQPSAAQFATIGFRTWTDVREGNRRQGFMLSILSGIRLDSGEMVGSGRNDTAEC
jgi:hypothetical protein